MAYSNPEFESACSHQKVLLQLHYFSWEKKKPQRAQE